MTLPRAIRPFVEFAALLRANGFAIAPDQTMGFIEAIGLLGPRNMGDIRRAAIALLAIPRDRWEAFDQLFNAHFLGHTLPAAMPGDEEEEVEAHEPDGAVSEIEEDADDDEAGQDAAATERLGQRTLIPEDPEAALAAFARTAPARLPRRQSRRWVRARRGPQPDLRRTLREAVKRDGEIFTLAEQRRQMRQRRIVLLIDVSGSMAERSDDLLRFAHALGQAAERFEAFTLGTRLTRITAPLKLRDRTQALDRVSRVVADFDGGTRIGEALQAFLSVPRYAGFARGAVTVVLSDGLERGSPEAMTDAVRRLSRIARSIHWLSPLATDPGFTPETEALARALPYIDHLGDGSSTPAICAHILDMARAA